MNVHENHYAEKLFHPIMKFIVNSEKRGDKNRTRKKGCNRDHPFIMSAKELDGWIGGWAQKNDKF